MRQLITEKDLNNLVGRFVVRVSEEDPDIDLSQVKDNRAGFWLEKRISFVGTLDLLARKYLDERFQRKGDDAKERIMVLNGIYYCHGIFTSSEFIDYFHRGYDNKGETFMRLLTVREMDWLNDQMKKRSL